MKLRFAVELLFYTFCSIVTAKPATLKTEKKPFTIEEATLNQFPIVSFSGKWISDNKIEYLDKETEDVKVLNVEKNQTEVVLKGSVLKKYKTSKYSFSPDRKFVLICYDEKRIYRHSKNAKYVVYSIKDEEYYDVSKKEELQIAEWGTKNNTLAYIKGNNIYVILSIGRKMEALQITTNGNPGKIINGMGDWIYEEEILSSAKAFWFSPGGDQLTFASFCDVDVKKAVIPEYGEPGDIKNQYTEQIQVPYPKSGSLNPTYELRHVFFNNTKNITLVSKSSPGKEIFYDLKWISNEAFIFLQTNRVQNESKIFECNVKRLNNCQMVFQHNNTKGWANTNLPKYNENLHKILRIEGISMGESGNFKHLTFYNTNGTFYPLTKGFFEVIKIVHWDESKKIIYYSATEEFNATATQIFAVGEAKNSKPLCLTCRIKSLENRNCKEASASFSDKSSYVIISCNGPDPKIVYLYKNVHPFDKPLAVLESNSKLRSALQKKLLPDILNLTVEIPGPYKADVRLFLPPKMDKSGKTKYPLIIYVYGGPSSKNINDAFKVDWGYYLSTNLSIIYGLIDGRNTLRKGENMLFAGYKALGTVEMEDQINVTRILQNKFPFIDPRRTAIWGWSYGGYATTKILEMDTQNIFSCGIAVAPVADWIYYDSMYSERYMGLPQDNWKSYEKASVLKDLSKLSSKKYFLIHGNADDNVHYQNAMMIAKLLERNNIPFELMSYPDEDHSLQNVRKHLYYTMDKFWKECFNIHSNENSNAIEFS